MTTARWSTGLETGHPVVDRQHRELFDLCEEFEQTETHAASALVIAERIMDHVGDHFACEEALMDSVEYPSAEREDHVSDHLELKDRARGLILRLRTDEGFEKSQLVDYLCTWLVHHTTTRDMALVGFIRERG